MTASGRRRSPGGRTLIVNADDLGMSSGINRGIVDAHRFGIVTSATVMTNMPEAQRGIELAQRQAPDLGLGLHVNLSLGRPVLAPGDVSSLVQPDGRFLSVARGLATPRRWNRHDVAAEVTAQFDRFVAYAGRLPDHLDAHQLVSSLSMPCRSVVLALAEKHDLPVRRSRATWFGPLERALLRARSLPPPLAGIVDRVPRPWRRGPMRARRPLATDGLDVRFFGEHAKVASLLRILDELPEGVTELVCHPGYRSDASDDYPHREAELAALTDARVREKIADADITLATFGDLGTWNA